ncbi:hypothetical protein [Hymenobacter defluvii]|uniref:Uncharacterized protein n=1 Tax=Hymenobacter defluvii TaxID=2054411 RepID=A0ABS3TBN1_9BACT|nr:hypothetical protein [Hymenobacter defluvii]MBO3271036.1 hypothetical protein [Hymenobacter defluvii]
MKTLSMLLVGGTLLCLSLSAAAQTTPAAKPKAKTIISDQPRTNRKAASKNLTVIKDTAAFRRSSRPGMMPIRVKPSLK